MNAISLSSSRYTAPFMTSVKRPMERKEIKTACFMRPKFFLPKQRKINACTHGKTDQYGCKENHEGVGAPHRSQRRFP